MITMEVLTHYAFIHRLLDAAGLFPAKPPFDTITVDTSAELVLERLNQDGSNFTLDYTQSMLENVILQSGPTTLNVIGTVQCTRAEAMLMKLRHHVANEFELRPQP